MPAIASGSTRDSLPRDAADSTRGRVRSVLQIQIATGKLIWGAGTDTNIELASIKAVLSAVNRAG
ncbi:MAG: hypothetical protein IPK32_02720 [Verrucomicrobiaceae bacterium]|nr:hypothetical protein [Verrucomicrobiaceae bacterium]